MWNQVGQASDLVVLTLLASISAAMAIGLAELAHRFLFASRLDEVDPHSKQFEVVHGSLLAFIAFMLAISVTEVRSNFGKADDAVSREGMHVASFARDLGEQDAAWAGEARALLARYVEVVTTDEWARLGAIEPSLSPDAQVLLDRLRGKLRDLKAGEATRASLFSRHDALELDRSIRYEHATRSIPRVFWLLIGGFLVGAMVMNGRYRQTFFTRTLVGVHFAAIGLSVALIVILDAPFRGETSIGPAPLVAALRHFA
jgi:hypothetical protein